MRKQHKLFPHDFFRGLNLTLINIALIICFGCNKPDPPQEYPTSKERIYAYVNDFIVHDRNKDGKVDEKENAEFVKQFDSNNDKEVVLKEVLDFIYSYEANTDD